RRLHGPGDLGVSLQPRQGAGLHLRWREVLRHVNRHLRQAQLLRSEQPRVPADDHSVLIDDDGNAKPEFFDRCGDLVDRALWNFAAVPRIRNRFVDGPPTHYEIIHPTCSKWFWNLAEGALCAGPSNRVLVSIYTRFKPSCLLAKSVTARPGAVTT